MFSGKWSNLTKIISYFFNIQKKTEVIGGTWLKQQIFFQMQKKGPVFFSSRFLFLAGFSGVSWSKFDLNSIWMFPKIVVPPKSSHFNRVFHYKPSILGYPYFWKHPYVFRWLVGSPSTKLEWPFTSGLLERSKKHRGWWMVFKSIVLGVIIMMVTYMRPLIGNWVFFGNSIFFVDMFIPKLGGRWIHFFVDPLFSI